MLHQICCYFFLTDSTFWPRTKGLCSDSQQISPLKEANKQWHSPLNSSNSAQGKIAEGPLERFREQRYSKTHSFNTRMSCSGSRFGFLLEIWKGSCQKGPPSLECLRAAEALCYGNRCLFLSREQEGSASRLSTMPHSRVLHNKMYLHS